MAWTNFVNNKCHSVVIKICGACGRNAYLHPYIFNVLGVAITLLCGMGFVTLKFQTDTFKLWIPEEAEVLAQYNDYEEKFGYSGYFGIVMVEEKGRNILTPERLPLTEDVFNYITFNLTIDYDYTDDTSKIQFTDICDQVPVENILTSSLELTCASYLTSMWYPYQYAESLTPYQEAFGYMYTPYEFFMDAITQDTNTQGAILLLMGDESDFIELAEVDDGMNGTTFSPYLGGGSQLRTRWQFSYAREVQNLTFEEERKLQEKVDEEFLQAVEDYFVTDKHLDDLRNIENGTDISMVYAGSNSLINESTRNILDAIPLLIGACLWMFILFSLMLGDMGCVKGRPWLALIGVFVVLMSLIIGFGLGFAFGLQANAFCLFLIFIVIASSFANENTIIESINNTPLPPANKTGESTEMKLGARRFWLALRDAGLGVTVATTIKLAAFGACSIVPLPGLSAFCLFTMFTLLAEYLLQFLIFLPVVGLDEHRKMTSGTIGDKDVKHTSKSNTSASPSSKSKGKGPPPVPADAGGDRGAVQFIIRNCLLQILAKRLNRVCIILFFIGIWSASIVAFLNIEGELELTTTLPDDSYAVEYLKVTEEGWGTLTFPEYEIVVENVDFSDNDTQWRFYNMMNELATTEIRGTSLVSTRFVWWYSFQDYLTEVAAGLNEALSGFGLNFAFTQLDINGTIDFSSIYVQANLGINYYDALNNFAEFSLLYDDWIVYDTENPAEATQIVYTKFTVLWDKPREFNDQYLVKEEIDEILRKYFSKNQIYTMDRYMPYYYIPHFVLDVAYESLFIVLLVVICLLPLLMDLRLALFMAFTILLVYLTIFGWMGLCGLNVDLISLIMLVSSVGIVVDYMIFITHAMIADDIKRRHFGAIVIRTAFACVLGSILVVFIQSPMFRTFVAMFTGTVIVTALHGLLWIPAVMGELECLYLATYIPEMETWHTENPSDLQTKMDKQVEMGGTNKKGDFRRQESQSGLGSQNHSRSQSGGLVRTGTTEPDQENNSPKAVEDSQSGQNNFSDLGALAATDRPQQTGDKRTSAGPRAIIQPQREDSRSHVSTSSRGRGHTEIKRDMQEINSITADIMVLAVEFELDKKKKKQLKRINKRISTFSDTKVNDLHQILKQVQIGKERGLETDKIKALFIEEVDDFIEENADLFTGMDEESSQSAL